MASHSSPGAGNDWRWSRRLGPRLRAAIAEAEPRALVFDGILPWDPLLAAIRSVPLTVWCRRGLWRPGASAVPLTRGDRFDAVLEPGELAADEDRGPTAAERERRPTRWRRSSSATTPSSCPAPTPSASSGSSRG